MVAATILEDAAPRANLAAADARGVLDGWCDSVDAGAGCAIWNGCLAQISGDETGTGAEHFLFHGSRRRRGWPSAECPRAIRQPGRVAEHQAILAFHQRVHR